MVLSAWMVSVKAACRVARRVARSLAPAGVKLNVSAFTALAGVSHRFLEGSWRQVDALVGARFWSMGNKVTVRPGAAGIGARGVDTDGFTHDMVQHGPVMGLTSRF
jgi:hypothetical protein